MSINIRSIRLREITLPLKEPFKISSGEVTVRRILLVEMTDADGVSAWSECVAGEFPNYSPETIATAWHAIREWVIPRALGRDLDHPDAVSAVLSENFRGHNMAKAAIEMGVWTLHAERLGESLAATLGSTRNNVPCGISIGIQQDPATLVEKAQQALATGYLKLKLKIRPGADIDYVSAVREALGPAAPLMVDANNAYVPDDFDHLKKLDALDLIMIEQPLAWDDLLHHARLQQVMKTPICLDESITGVGKVEEMLALGSGRIVNIKAGRVGGLREAKAIHDLCALNGIPVWCGGMLESGIGRAYNVALASLPNFSIPGDISPSSRYWLRDIVTPEWRIGADGMMTVPRAKPGIGVTVDVDTIDDLTVRTEVVSAPR
ncbi:MAG: o-succinylbenzoate synthase [Gemmatimonadales bacterium]